MNRCPKCGGQLLTASNERIGSSGYRTKVIKCAACYTVLGTTLSDEVQEMIEITYNKINHS